MTDTRRTLLQARSWEAGASVDVWIELAGWAILHEAGVTLPLTRREDGTYDCVLLHLTGDGLEAAVDLHLDAETVAERVGEDWELTRSWATAEDHLRAQREADKLVPQPAD